MAVGSKKNANIDAMTSANLRLKPWDIPYVYL